MVCVPKRSLPCHHQKLISVCQKVTTTVVQWVRFSRWCAHFSRWWQCVRDLPRRPLSQYVKEVTHSAQRTEFGSFRMRIESGTQSVICLSVFARSSKYIYSRYFWREAPRFDSSWRLTFSPIFLPPMSGEVPTVLSLELHVPIFLSGVWVHDNAAVCCAALFGTGSRDILV